MATFVPQARQNFLALAALGEGLASILDPHRERRELIEQSLIDDPERAAALARRLQAQEQGLQAGAEVTETLADTLAGLGVFGVGPGTDVQPTQEVDVLGQAFTPEQEREFLSIFGVETPSELLTRETAEAELEAGVPQVQAEEKVETGRAAVEQARFQQQFFGQLDPILSAQAQNLEAEFGMELTEEKQKTLRNLDELIKGNPELRLALLEGGPSMLNALINREEMALRERLALAEQAENAQDRQVKLLEAKLDAFDQVEESMDRVTNLMTEQPEGWKEMIDAEVANLNRTTAAVNRVFPEETAYVANVTKRWLLGVGIDIREIPVIASQPQLQGVYTELLETAATNEDASIQDLLQSDKLRSLLNALPARSPQRQQIRNSLIDVVRQRQEQEGISEGRAIADPSRRLQPDERRELGTEAANAFKEGLSEFVQNWIDTQVPGTERGPRQTIPTGAAQ